MPSSDDDARSGTLFRLLRSRAGLTQEEIAAATSIPVRDIRNLENGRLGDIMFERIRALFAQVDARTRLSVWWNGAAADRLLDAEHAAIVERGAVVITSYGWTTPTEVTFSEFGERGSIDIFGHREATRAVAVCEVKSSFGSLEELNRSLDAKVRLAPTICRKRFGWTPVHVGRLLIVPDEATIRRVVAAHRRTMDGAYPASSREIRAWLRNPDRSIAGIWFLSNPRNRPTVPPPEP